MYSTMYNSFKEGLRWFGLIAVVALALMAANCEDQAYAQEGVIPNQELTIEEQLSKSDGPVDLGLVWDYLISAFGDPYTAEDVVIFDVGIVDENDVFHIQLVARNGAQWHKDIPLDNVSVGGAMSDDGTLQFIWFCDDENIEDPLVGCTPPLATWVIGYDFDIHVVFRWPERIQ